MEYLVCIFVVLLIGIAITESVLFLKFQHELLNIPKSSGSESIDWPRVAVILSLRGIDPSLNACLSALFKQDYPDCHIHVIVDSEDDSAWQVVKEVVDDLKPKNITVETLKVKHTDCSLKCSSVIQALASTPEDTEILAFLDADVIPHQSWLKELVAPLIGSDISVVSGLRWYGLGQKSPGNMLRYLWNAASIVLIYWHKIPWGGSLAIRRDVFDKTSYVQRIKQSLGEDTVLGNVCHEYGLKVKMVPSLIQINEEVTSLRGSLRWIVRQLISSRLHHPRWNWVLLSGLFTQSVLFYGFALAITNLVTQEWYILFFLLVTYAGYIFVQLLMLMTAQKAISNIVISREKSGQIMSAAFLGKILVYIPMTQWIYPWLLIYAQFSRSVRWRGVDYLINRAGEVRLLQYQPYRQPVNDESIL